MHDCHHAPISPHPHALLSTFHWNVLAFAVYASDTKSWSKSMVKTILHRIDRSSWSPSLGLVLLRREIFFQQRRKPFYENWKRSHAIGIRCTESFLNRVLSSVGLTSQPNASFLRLSSPLPRSLRTLRICISLQLRWFSTCLFIASCDYHWSFLFPKRNKIQSKRKNLNIDAPKNAALSLVKSTRWFERILAMG